MTPDFDTLRAALRGGEVRVLVALPSGPCWASLRAVRRGRGGAPRAELSVAGVRVEVPLSALREASA